MPSNKKSELFCLLALIKFNLSRIIKYKETDKYRTLLCRMWIAFFIMQSLWEFLYTTSYLEEDEKFMVELNLCDYHFPLKYLSS